MAYDEGRIFRMQTNVLIAQDGFRHPTCIMQNCELKKFIYSLLYSCSFETNSDVWLRRVKDLT